MSKRKNGVPWQNKEEWRNYGLGKKYNEMTITNISKSNDYLERSWYNKGRTEDWIREFRFYRNVPWQTFDEWKQYGLESEYNKLTSTKIQKGDARSWYKKGQREGWLQKFKFEKRMIKGRWKTKEEWNQYGLERKYNEITITNLSKSDIKKERSWYKKGEKEKWIGGFKFKKKVSWQTFDEWKQYGVRNRFNERSPTTLDKSRIKEERSWYKKGQRENWVNEFTFVRKRNNNTWKTFKEWKQYGLEHKFNERNPYSLSASKEDLERRWYSSGNNKKWLNKFSFKRSQKILSNWDSFKLEIENTIRENGGDFPKHVDLTRLNKKYISYAAYKYYGNLYEVREKIGYNDKMSRQLAKELEKIVQDYE